MTNQWLRWMNLSEDKRRAQSWTGLDSAMRAIGYVGLGAGLMYFLDPDRGRRRRALCRDQMAHAVNVLGDAASTTSRDFSHRAYGLWAETSHLFEQDEPSDEVLEARVRSKLGRAVSHPHAIHVTTREGHVILSGDVLADEADYLLACVAKVRGVRTVENQLTIHASAADVPSLQGGRRRDDEAFELMQHNWSPTARLLAGAAGGALMAYCIKRRDAVGEALGTLGFGLFMRGVTNLEMKSLIGVGRDSGTIEVQKTIHINAPVEQVFTFWTNYQNFPRFMSNVREVRPTSSMRSQWTVAGPAGVPIEWTAEITKIIPNQLLTWETVPGSTVSSSGAVHFEPQRGGGTTVHIQLCYRPPAGALGHTLAKFFGADPKSEMDADLVRMKTLIETGHAPHDAAQPLPTGNEAALARTTTA